MGNRQTDILLVEDNADDVELTLLAFRRVQLVPRIDVVRDGEEALEYIFRTGRFADRPAGCPRLILLDLKMPRLDGLQVLARLKSDSEMKTIPVVVLTSSRQMQDINTAYQAGANSYIRKPVDFDEFSEVVRQLGVYWMSLNHTCSRQ